MFVVVAQNNNYLQKDVRGSNEHFDIAAMSLFFLLWKKRRCTSVFAQRVVALHVSNFSWSTQLVSLHFRLCNKRVFLIKSLILDSFAGIHFAKHDFSLTLFVPFDIYISCLEGIFDTILKFVPVYPAVQLHKGQTWTQLLRAFFSGTEFPPYTHSHSGRMTSQQLWETLKKTHLITGQEASVAGVISRDCGHKEAGATAGQRCHYIK